jgi:hypothetical protein
MELGYTVNVIEPNTEEWIERIKILEKGQEKEREVEKET